MMHTSQLAWHTWVLMGAAGMSLVSVGLHKWTLKNAIKEQQAWHEATEKELKRTLDAMRQSERVADDAVRYSRGWTRIE